MMWPEMERRRREAIFDFAFDTIALCVLAPLVGTGFKLFGGLPWSWWWITAPLWLVPVALVAAAWLLSAEA